MMSTRIIVVRPNGELWESKSVLDEKEEDQIITRFLNRLMEFERPPVDIGYFPDNHSFEIKPGDSRAYQEIRALTFKYVTRYYGWGYPRHK